MRAWRLLCSRRSTVSDWRKEREKWWASVESRYSSSSRPPVASEHDHRLILEELLDARDATINAQALQIETLGAEVECNKLTVKPRWMELKEWLSEDWARSKICDVLTTCDELSVRNAAQKARIEALEDGLAQITVARREMDALVAKLMEKGVEPCQKME